MKRLIAGAAVGGTVTAAVLLHRRLGRLRLRRGLSAIQLLVRGGMRYAGCASRLFAAAGENRQQLRSDLALQTAEDVAATLGAMKGALMKMGQMASYIDGGLSPAVRRTLSRPQDSAPPRTADLGGRGESTIPRKHGDQRGRSRQRGAAAPDAAHHRSGAGRRRAARRTAGARAGGARLPPGGRQS